MILSLCEDKISCIDIWFEKNWRRFIGDWVEHYIEHNKCAMTSNASVFSPIYLCLYSLPVIVKISSAYSINLPGGYISIRNQVDIWYFKTVSLPSFLIWFRLSKQLFPWPKFLCVLHWSGIVGHSPASVSRYVEYKQVTIVQI